MRAEVALAAALICTPARAGCHKFSIWHYPWRQSCWVHSIRYEARPARPARPVTPLPPLKGDRDIPLPDVAFTPCPAASDEDAGRILLRARLGESHDR
jgi:hypothetical protein